MCTLVSIDDRHVAFADEYNPLMLLIRKYYVIANCKKFFLSVKECLDTRSGLEYRGTNSTPSEGGTCEPWSNFANRFKTSDPLTHPLTGIF